MFELLLLAIIGSVVSLAGGLLLYGNRRAAHTVAQYSEPFAAGALIAAVFVDILPEALELGGDGNALMWAIVGIVGFFILERRLSWFHHHHEHEGDKARHARLPVMIMVGDTLHNAIDGAVIAFAYLADPAIGVVTTFAVALHELPQEIGDFGLLKKAGWSQKKVLLANLMSALATVITALVVYLIGSDNESVIAPALALTAGTLLYIALSDLIPSVHSNKPSRKWLDGSVLLLLLGVLIVWGSVRISHNYIHSESSPSGHSAHE